ncbi:Di-copper centre-containing protein [Clavulina sp. PMI_390]|nr:Di-copper centre-containing protein [Clavulina sp. PMI_390]
MLVPLHLIFAAFTTVGAATSHFPVCKKPHIRKEWRDMAKHEQKSFIDAVKCMGTKVPAASSFFKIGWGGNVVPVLPPQERTLWDDFTYSHMDTNGHTHFVGSFLPWHRMFLRSMEAALQDHCGYTGGLPYWDWTLDVADLSKAPVFDPSPIYGFGTWGRAANNWTITDGAFANWTRVYPWPHVISRRYEAQPFKIQGVYPLPYNHPNKWANTTVTPAAIKALIEGFKGDAYGFQVAIEGERCEGLHSAMHYIFGPQTNVNQPGADMGDASYSPNDPLFYLHHANMDRIWQKWKDFHPANAQIVGGGTIKNLSLYDQYPQGLPPNATASDWLVTSGLSVNVTIGDVFNTMQGYTCYLYQDPLEEKKGQDF